MPIHHIDTTHTPTATPGQVAAPASPIWIEIRPDLRRSAAIATDILTALGKRRDVAGIGRNQNEDIALAIAWMRAYNATALVATETQRLTPLLLRQLVAIADAAHLPLWLLHRSPRTDTFTRALQRHHAHPRHLDETPPPQPRTQTAPVRPSLGLSLPDAPFHQFLTACHATLPASALQRVTLRHASTAAHCHTVLHRDGATTDVLARLTETILRAAPADDLLITDIRALQLAAWHHDIYLRSDIPTLLASPERQLTDPDTVDTALTAYRQPHRAIAVTLAMHQVGVHHITHLPIRAATADGATITLPTGRTIDLPQHAAAALRALLTTRAHQAAEPDAPLLNVPERAISVALNDANTDLNIRVHGRRAERHIHPSRWLRKLGLTPHPLA